MKALIALLLALAAGPLAAQDAPLRRLETLGAAQAWQAVGRLDMRGKGFCTGTLISPDLVLTAAHCVMEAGAVMPARNVTFRAGLRLGRSHATRDVRRIFVLPERGDTARAETSDLALVELARPVRRAGFTPARVGRGIASGAPLGVVSYAAGRAEAPSLQARCRALGQSGGIHVLSCAAGFGSSGAPVFAAAADGPRVVGVILAISTLGAERVSLAHGLGLPLERLLALAEAEDSAAAGAFHGLAPGQRRDTGAKVVRPPAP